MAKELVSEGCSPTKTCRALKVPRSSFYYSIMPRISNPLFVRSKPANWIPEYQRQEILNILYCERFVDRTPWEIVPTLLDEGQYLGSIRTFYRILAAKEQASERRNQSKRIKYNAPILEATQSNQVWTWDITRVPGPFKGQYYFLYVMLDIYSRYAVGWMLAERENGRKAQHFIRETVRNQNCQGQQLTIHNDRGSPMISGGTKELIDLLGLEQSFSRPRTSDDNPFSESQFRTVKYSSTFPSFFESFPECEQYLEKWFLWYNNEHKHTGLNLLTPVSVHLGKATEIVNSRQEIMSRAFAMHPERFSKGVPKVKLNPQIVGINLKFKPTNTLELAATE